MPRGVKEIGYISFFYSGVAKIKGLPHVFLHELLVNEEEAPVGIVMGFDQKEVDVLLLDEDVDIASPVFRSKKVFSIPVSNNYHGRILNGFGEPIDERGEITGKLTPVFANAPAIIDRTPVSRPLTTGIKVIDSMLSLGRGQRELIIGDNKLGKSTLAIDTVLHQRHEDAPITCIYVLCGKPKKKLDELLSIFDNYGAFTYTTIVAATADNSFASLYLAPFVGCTLGEHMRDKGQDALIIYDDLTSHAKAYRDIALLFKRAPGREAYPGDIFSLHASLLERAAQLSAKKGGGSLTALPIIETLEGDITSFIPTNLISITDGQIYLERSLFQKHFLPAVNVGLSVSRVGSQAQQPLFEKVTKGLRLILSQYKEFQKLVQLETTISEESKKKVHHGELLLELLKQDKHKTLGWEEQVLLFYSADRGYFDDLKKEEWSQFKDFFLDLVRSRYPVLLQKIKEESFEVDKDENEVRKLVNDFKKEFLSKKEAYENIFPVSK